MTHLIVLGVNILVVNRDNIMSAWASHGVLWETSASSGYNNWNFSTQKLFFIHAQNILHKDTYAVFNNNIF